MPVHESELCDFELKLQEEFRRAEAPDEIYAFAAGRPGQILSPQHGIPVGRLTISIRGKEGKLESYYDDAPERFYSRTVSQVEVDAIRKFVREHKLDELPELTSERGRLPHGSVRYVLGGAQYLYLHL